MEALLPEFRGVPALTMGGTGGSGSTARAIAFRLLRTNEHIETLCREEGDNGAL